MYVPTFVLAACSIAILLLWQRRLRLAEMVSNNLMAGADALTFARDAALSSDGWRDSPAANSRRPSLHLVEPEGINRPQHLGELASALGGTALFATLTHRQLTMIASISRRRNIATNEVIVRQGERDGTDLYCVLRGHLKVTIHGQHGQELLINILQPHDAFGEIAFFDKMGRSATVTSMEASELVVIARDDFDRLLDTTPTLAVAMLTAQARLIRSLTERAEDNAFLDVRARLAKRLIALADGMGTQSRLGEVTLNVPLTQEDLGHMIDARRTSVNKCLREWIKEGVIRRNEGRLVIRDRKRLQALSVIAT